MSEQALQIVRLRIAGYIPRFVEPWIVIDLPNDIRVPEANTWLSPECVDEIAGKLRVYLDPTLAYRIEHVAPGERMVDFRGLERAITQVYDDLRRSPKTWDELVDSDPLTAKEFSLAIERGIRMYLYGQTKR